MASSRDESGPAGAGRATDPVRDFYDPLADHFHLVHKDWEASIANQGAALDRMIRARLGDRPHDVLDCACGIGTQALGLAARGHRVHATDLSPESVARTEREAAARGLDIDTGVADLRELETAVAGTFDAVIACDNALAHMLDDDDLARACAGMAAKARPGGLVLASIRDYDALIADKPSFAPSRIFDRPDSRRVVFQLWDWLDDGRRYRTTLFILQKRNGDWTMRHFASTLRAVTRDEVGAAFARAGLCDIAWHAPGDDAYYQPAVTATRPREQPGREEVRP